MWIYCKLNKKLTIKLFVNFSRQEEEDNEPERPRFIPSRGRIPSRGGAAAALPKRAGGISAPKLSAPNSDGYKVVCYYTNWSQYRPKKGKFEPEDIDPFLCTHVIFAFGWIKDGKLTSFEAGDVKSEQGKLGLYQVWSLKQLSSACLFTIKDSQDPSNSAKPDIVSLYIQTRGRERQYQ